MLATYEAERRPIAAGVLCVLARHLIEQGLAPEAAQEAQERVRRDIFNLDYNYRGSTLAIEHRQRSALVRAGDRAPDAVITLAGGRKVRLFDLLKEPTFTAIWLNGEKNYRKGGVGNDLAESCKTYVAVPVSRETLGDVYDVYAVGRDDDNLLLIRPDGYVALLSGVDGRIRDDLKVFARSAGLGNLA